MGWRCIPLFPTVNGGVVELVVKDAPLSLTYTCIPLFPTTILSAFDEYLVDVGEGEQWAKTLEQKLMRLQTSASYRATWYQTRRACLVHWEAVAKRFHNDMSTQFRQLWKLPTLVPMLVPTLVH